jgi:hypothetical protein
MNVTLTEKDLYAIRRGLRLMVIARSSTKDKSEFPANERMAELMKLFEADQGQVSWG